jgi:2-polyprenyl-6-methoxyphenol hydroxylase-like FAD-dependent oxidoreductase
MAVVEQTDVLIVGAGPVGLALAIELGRRGLRCLVVEKNDRVGLNPRAKTTNARTREHLRRWGIAENLRKASALPADYPSDIIFTTRLSGPQLTKIDNAFNCSPEKNDLYSESGQWVPQFVLEEVLRAYAVTLPGVQVRFNTDYLSAVQDAQGVTATVRGAADGREYQVHGQYMVGADGSHSVVRETVGATMKGTRNIAQNFNVQFRAPALTKLHKHGRAIMYWQINSEVPSVLGPMGDVWYFIATRVDSKIEGTEEELKALIQRSTGFEFELEILGSSPWAAHSLIADKYSSGRIYLAGDACHLHPPFGGYGMNMGIADGVDLGWKLAAMLQGWGGEGLLESYEVERRPVHEWIIEEAIANYNALGNHLQLPGLEAPGESGEATRREAGDVIFAAKQREFRTLGAVLGYCYENSPVIVRDGSAAPPANSSIYRPSAHPGCLAPHLWLSDGTSLYDHFGEGFTLLVTVAGDNTDTSQAEDIARTMQVPLKVLRPEESRLRPRYGASFALIRPDQHVVWRGESVADLGPVLKKVTGFSQIPRHGSPSFQRQRGVGAVRCEGKDSCS